MKSSECVFLNLGQGTRVLAITVKHLARVPQRVEVYSVFQKAFGA